MRNFSYVVLGISSLLLILGVLLSFFQVSFMNTQFLIILIGLFALTSAFTIGDLAERYLKLEKKLNEMYSTQDNNYEKNKVGEEE